MEISSLLSLTFFIFMSLVQTDFVSANSNPVIGGIFERDAGEFEYTGKNDDERNKESVNQTTTTEFPISPEPPIEASICPDRSTIKPCNCTLDGGVYLICIGSTVNQATVENVFSEVRRVNGIPENRGIDIFRFDLDNTEMTQLDMAPFYGSRMEDLAVMDNSFLAKLVTSGNPKDHGTIHVNRVNFHSCPLNRDGFGDFFKYFSNEMTVINANYILLDGDNNPDEGEFLPGLSALTNLRRLDLKLSGITGRLNSNSWNFKGLQSLQDIDLYTNQINEIGEDVFNFDVIGDFFLEIDLRFNKLNESSFHPNSGIARVDRKTNLKFMGNQIATLPALIFESFFDAHPENVLSLDFNPLICDERLSWIKSRRVELQNRVEGADCSNDLGHTVFDSDLIP